MSGSSEKGKKCRIKKMRVHEVSLAAYPKNNFSFLTQKEGGKGMPTPIGKLLAYLAVKSSDVAEIVKEELRKDAPSEITAKDIIEAAKELGIKAEDFIPEGKVLANKDDIVDRSKFDVVEKGTWTKNTEDPYAGMSATAKEKQISLEKEVAALKEQNVRNELGAALGTEVAKELTPIYMTLKDTAQTYLVNLIGGLQKAVKDLGAKIGTNIQENPNAISQEQMTKEAQKIADDEKIPLSDAMIKWAERNPEKAANLV